MSFHHERSQSIHPSQRERPFAAHDLQQQATRLRRSDSISQISRKNRLLRGTNAFVVQKWEPETMAQRDDEFNHGRGWVRRPSAYQPSSAETIKQIESNNRLLRGTNASVLRQNEAEDSDRGKMMTGTQSRRGSVAPSYSYHKESRSPPRNPPSEPTRRRSSTHGRLDDSPPRPVASKHEESAPKEEEENVFAAFAKMSAGGMKKSISRNNLAAAEDDEDQGDGSTMSAFAAFARRPSMGANIVSDMNAFHNR